MKSSPARIAVVTAGLLVAGALFGSIAAAIGATIAVALAGKGFAELYGLTMVGVATLIGGVLGAPLLPATSWLLLRRVPMGRSWLGTTAGAVVGGLAGWFAALAVPGDEFLWPITGALIGFFAAVPVLRIRFSSRADGAGTLTRVVG
jgi:hypothetical protein